MRRATIADRQGDADAVDVGRVRLVDSRDVGDRDAQINERTGRQNKLYNQGLYGNGPYGGAN